nr:protein rae1 [Quercus suber]
MAAETLLLSNGAVANGDLSSNPNPNLNPTKKSRDTERRCHRRRKQKKNSKASQAPSSDANDDDSNHPQQGSCCDNHGDWTYRYWDTRQSNPVSNQQLPDHSYSFTVRHLLMVVCPAVRNLIVFNLLSPQGKRGIEKQPFQLPESVVSAWGL